MAHDVFISYSHHDKSTADAVCAKLEGDGIRCWYAPRDIQPGADWAECIVHAIEASRIMVLIFTDRSNLSRQVLNEISVAVNRGVIVIPFRLTDAPPSKGLQYYFTSIHWLDAVDRPLEKSIGELRQMIRRILSGTPEEPETAAPADIRPKHRRNGWIIAAVIVLALAAAAVFLIPRLLPGKNAETKTETESAGPLPWPETGEIDRSRDLADSPVDVIFRVDQNAQQATFIRILQDGENPVSSVFIGGDQSALIHLPAGRYSVRYACGATGTEWYGPEETIRNGIFSSLIFGSNDEETVYLEEGQEYTITITNPLP